jgi:hypothetical protein
LLQFLTFGQVYEERFQRQYGFFRPYVQQSFTGILIVVTFTTDLPVSDAGSAAMSIS